MLSWSLQWSVKLCQIQNQKGSNSCMADGNKLKYPWTLLNLYAEVHTLTAETPKLSRPRAFIKSCWHYWLSSYLPWNQILVWAWCRIQFGWATQAYMSNLVQIYILLPVNPGSNHRVPPIFLLLPRKVLYTCLPFIKTSICFQIKE